MVKQKEIQYEKPSKRETEILFAMLINFELAILFPRKFYGPVTELLNRWRK